MENKDFAQLLSETADLMEIAGEDGFRIRSYRNAASAILGHPERVQDILTNPERKVTDIGDRLNDAMRCWRSIRRRRLSC